MATTTTPYTPDATQGYAAKPKSEASFTTTAADESSQVLQKLREKKDAVMDSLQPRLEAVSSYARNDPTKAVLIAAASGAALMALVGLMSRSDRPSQRASRAMSRWRDVGYDFADRAQDAASDALSAMQRRAKDARSDADSVQKKGQSRAADLQQRASDMASSAGDVAAETWQSLRDQAAPVIERLRPQIDAVTNYAKEDPARAALGIAAAGAVLLGVLAMIRSSDD